MHREIYEKYAGSIAYISVRVASGDQSIGTAFHIGDGIFITARHVVEANQILEIATTASSYIRTDPEILKLEIPMVSPYGPVSVPSEGAVLTGPLFHPDKDVDVAALILEGIEAPAIKIDDALEGSDGTELIMDSAVVMGYPPIPHTRSPILVASRAEVTAIADVHAGHSRLILSCLARGGLSGGPVISTSDFLIGIVTEALSTSESSYELGYLAVLPVVAITEMLAYHKLI